MPRRLASGQRRRRTAGAWRSATGRRRRQALKYNKQNLDVENKDFIIALCTPSRLFDFVKQAPWQKYYAAALCGASHSTRTRCRSYWRSSKGSRAPLRCKSSKPRLHPRPRACAAPCAPAQRCRQAWPARDKHTTSVSRLCCKFSLWGG